MEEPGYLLSAGDLRAIVGGGADHGSGGDGYSGIWFLTSVKDGHTAVSQSTGILIFSHHRGVPVFARRVDGSAVELFREPTESNNFLETRGLYWLRAPHYIDYQMTVTARPGHKAQEEYAFNWCCYVNSPAYLGIHFLEKGRWTYYYNPLHGQGAMVFPTGLPEANREGWAQQPVTDLLDGKRSFHLSDSGHTFDYPFYFGTLRRMMFQIIADDYSGFRMFISPSGGGESLIPGERSPAWDFEWRTAPLDLNESRVFNVRVVYKSLDKRVQYSEAVPNGYAGDYAWAEFQKFRQEYPVRGLDR